MAKVEKLVTPWLEYRTQWDDMLEKAELITSWPEKEVSYGIESPTRITC